MSRSMSVDFDAENEFSQRLYEPLNDPRSQNRDIDDFLDNFDDDDLSHDRDITHNDFRTPLTPFTRSPVQFFQERFKAGSMKGSVFTLVVSIVGAGSLSVPFAVEKSGLVLGLGLFVIGALMASFTLMLLIVSAENARAKSYVKLAQKLYGKNLANLATITLLCNLYGTTISYIVASGNLISMVLLVVFGYDSKKTGGTDAPAFLKPSAIILIVTCTIITPLSLLKTMGALRYSSLLAVSCTLYLAVVVAGMYFDFCTEHVVVSISDGSYSENQTVQCFWEKGAFCSAPNRALTYSEAKTGTNTTEEYKFVSTDFVEVLTTIPIVVYAYTCHPNVLPVFLELRHANQRRMGKVISRATGLSLLMYLTLGCFGYLTFKSQLAHSSGNFLLNDYHHHYSTLLGAIGMSLSVVFAVPLFVNAFRSVLYNFLIPILDPEYVPPRSGRDHEMSSKWHYSITLGMIVFAVLPAISVDDISKVFTILGSTTNPILCFVFPALFIVKAAPPGRYRKTRIGAVLLAVLIPVVSITSLFIQIQQW